MGEKKIREEKFSPSKNLYSPHPPHIYTRFIVCLIYIRFIQQLSSYRPTNGRLSTRTLEADYPHTMDPITYIHTHSYSYKQINKSITSDCLLISSLNFWVFFFHHSSSSFGLFIYVCV